MPAVLTINYLTFFRVPFLFVDRQVFVPWRAEGIEARAYSRRFYSVRNIAGEIKDVPGVLVRAAMPSTISPSVRTKYAQFALANAVLGHATSRSQLGHHLIHAAAVGMRSPPDAGTNLNPRIFLFHNMFNFLRWCSAILDPTQVLSLLKSTPIIFPWLIRTRLLTRIGSGSLSGQTNIIRISALDLGPSGVGTNSAY